MNYIRINSKTIKDGFLNISWEQFSEICVRYQTGHYKKKRDLAAHAEMPH